MIDRPAPTIIDRQRERHAVLMLLIACVLWGVSFNWSKEAQSLIGHRLAEAAGDPRLESLGPSAFLAIRFFLAVLLWAVVFPASWRGWSTRTVWAGVWGGVMLGGGMLFQHYGLARTSESLSAFLTSLTVLFTPVMAFVGFRHHVPGRLWVSVFFATVGVALMTLNREEGRFDAGALLGLLCAVVFSGHILFVDAVGKSESPWRFALGQFAAAAMVFGAYSVWQCRESGLPSMAVWGTTLNSGSLWIFMGLSLVFATLGSFGLMFTFQPRTSPTRAALIYLSEPVFATVYAWLMTGRGITIAAMVGAGLIMAANGLAELRARNGAEQSMPPGCPHD